MENNKNKELGWKSATVAAGGYVAAQTKLLDAKIVS